MKIILNPTNCPFPFSGDPLVSFAPISCPFSSFYCTLAFNDFRFSCLSCLEPVVSSCRFLSKLWLKIGSFLPFQTFQTFKKFLVGQTVVSENTSYINMLDKLSDFYFLPFKSPSTITHVSSTSPTPRVNSGVGSQKPTKTAFYAY